MQEWAIVLIYAVVVIIYLGLHQLFFRFRFKECAYTVMFLNLVSAILMFATAFRSLFVWIELANVIILILYCVYVGIMMRYLRDKVQKQVLGGMDINDMFKSIMSMGGRDVKNDDVFGEGSGDINASEAEDGEANYGAGLSSDDFNVGDIIIPDKDKDVKNDGDDEDDNDKKEAE